MANYRFRYKILSGFQKSDETAVDKFLLNRTFSIDAVCTYYSLCPCSNCVLFRSITLIFWFLYENEVFLSFSVSPYRVRTDPFLCDLVLERAFCTEMLASYSSCRETIIKRLISRKLYCKI